MGYVDSQVHSYHYQNDSEMILRWVKETFPLPDEIEMKGKSTGAGSSGTGTNLPSVPAVGSGTIPGGNSNTTNIIGAGGSSHGLVNQYWDCFDDEEQWTMFHGLKMTCNGDLYKDGVLLGNNFHGGDRVTAINAFSKSHIPSAAPNPHHSSHQHQNHPNQGSRSSN
ncbi:HGR085Wp [Eremothecium sinecaudum]|uniref:HGR085Wp n=1 Tax=Eremothecium sinecaudum TaxID=45286 RepID=A0A0X8HVS5_9SACH|nr:HGR085Wp [Eremothecium sinecaudum]AMD22424.1 HGR085Wp [Eremothecium sinecaudum]